jgi:hypothetical protein
MANLPPQQAAAPAAAPAAPAQAAPALTNGLRGLLPAPFDGNRKKTAEFLRSFDIFWNMNENHEMFQTPFLRVNFALSLIRGDIVNDWVQQQLDELRAKVAPGGGYQRDQEILWTEFRTALTSGFTNTTEKQQAVTSLRELKMKGDDLDAYVAQFRGLVRKAGYQLDQPGTMDLFARGLKRQVLSSILTKRNQVPTTFQEWVDAAIDEEQKFATLVSYTSAAPWSRWTPPARSNKPYFKPTQPRNNQVVPMDVDVIRKAVTDADKVKHRLEGRCYECSKQGHLANKCPNKKRSKPLRPKDDPLEEYLKVLHPLAEEEEEEEEEEQLPDLFQPDSDDEEPTQDLNDIDALAARTAAFSPDEREAWVLAMQNLGVDFQAA